MTKVEKKDIKGAFDEFIKALKFRNDSKQGKFSIDTYLDMLGDYTDKLIIDTKKEGLVYSNGKCTVTQNELKDSLIFHVELFFTQKDKEEMILKELSVNKPKDAFVRETEDYFINEVALVYNIEDPKEQDT